MFSGPTVRQFTWPRPTDFDQLSMLKPEYLRYHHKLSDREVGARAQTDVTCPYFRHVPLDWKLLAPSSPCIFRGFAPKIHDANV